jgi:hypothetical protein
LSDLSDDALLLLRRTAPDGIDARSGLVRHTAFRLRPSRGETSLSFFDGALTTPAAVNSAAPGTDWGVAAIRAGELRQLGFEIRSDPTDDSELGRAHISAVPPELVDGQIPLAVREAIAMRAFWAIHPAPG